MYERAGRALGFELFGEPALAETPHIAARVPDWWGCNYYLYADADSGDLVVIPRTLEGKCYNRHSAQFVVA